MPRMVLGGFLALLLLAAPASAATTIGSSLSAAPAIVGPCMNPPNAACTLASPDLPAGSKASGGVASPIDGVIVKWRLKLGSGGPAFDARPRVIAATNGVAVGDTVSVPGTATTYVYETRLPIAAGQIVGLDLMNYPIPSAPPVTATTSGASLRAWSGSHGTGDMGAPGSQSNTELLVNADVEPDADHDGWGDETQDRCPTDASTHDDCPPPPKQIINTPSSGSGGSGGSSGGSSTPVVNPGIVVTAPPPLPTPVVTKTKAKKKPRCTRRQKKRHRCPKPKRKRRR